MKTPYERIRDTRSVPERELKKLLDDIGVVFLAMEIAKLGDRGALEEIRKLGREASMRQMKRFSRGS